MKGKTIRMATTLAKNIAPPLIPGTPAGIEIYSVTGEQPHYHEGFLEIIYCLKGPAIIRSSYEDIALAEGDVFSCDQYDIHRLSSDNDNLFASFYFDLNDPVFKKPGLPDIFFVCERYVLKKEQQDRLQDLKHILLTMLYFYCFPHEKVSNADTFRNLSVKVVEHMLSHFHFFDYCAKTAHQELSPTDAKGRFERLLIHANRHYDEKLTLKKFSEMEHLNSNYLSHFFQKTSFFSFSGFMGFIRIYHSERLLLTTNDNIADIAYAVGFSHPKFYYKRFKAFYKRTPLQYKKAYEKLAAAAAPNVYYTPIEIRSELEHYISYYFATLHIPEFWNVPYIPFRNVPPKSY